MKKWWLAAALLAALSLDIWGWEQSQPLLWFLPFWGWYIVVLVLAYAGFFALLVMRLWRTA